MKGLDQFIDKHYQIDRSRNSFSNLIKKLKLENEFFSFIEMYLDFGTFKQKLYHYINGLPKDKILCSVCNKNYTNWIENDNTYRTTCSIKCAGKLTGTKNKPKREKHPYLKTNDQFINYFNLNKIKLVESSLSKIYPKLVLNIKKNIKLKTDTFSEKVYFYLYDFKNRPLCKHCNYNIVKFDTFTKGYHDYCSVKCSSNSKDKKDKIEKTCLSKYGVKNISEVTRDKALETMNNKFGCHISQTNEYKEKYIKTCLERYGAIHFSIIDTLNKFKIDNPMNNPEIVEKGLITKKKNGLIYKWTSQDIKDIKSYRRSVSYYTEKSYNENKHILNPDNLERGIKSNHIDHIFPVIEGWKNRVDPKDISHYKNLRIISSYDNLSKGERTDIDIESFFDMINS